VNKSAMQLDEVLTLAEGKLPGWALAVLKARTRKAIDEGDSSKSGQVVSDGPNGEASRQTQKRGLMIALMLPKAVAIKLAQEGGELPEKMHCTLAYPGKVEDLPADALERAKRAVAKVAAEFAPFVAMIGGVGRFNASLTSDGKDVLHASLDAPILPALQQAIAAALDEEKMSPKREHGFDPHVTLCYQDKGTKAELPQVPTTPVIFESLSIVAGDERIADVPLAGVRVFKSEPIAKKLTEAQRAEVELETERIRERCKTPEARQPHAFKAAEWTHPNGHPRCAVCGDEEPVGGRCEGYVEKSGPTPGDAHVDGPLWGPGYDSEYVAEMMAEMRRRDLTLDQAKARAKSELRDEGATVEEAAELVAKARPLSREYLEEAWTLARKVLPPWAWAQIHQQARPKASVRGAARVREEEPTLFEKIALTDIRPGKLRELPDDEVRLAWARLHQWHANAKRTKRPIENFVNAALWTLDEMARRGIDVERDDELVRAIEELRGKRASVDTFAKLNALPRDLVVVRDFVSVVGSTAKGDRESEDLDVLLRAPWNREAGHFAIQAENIWLPLRNALDADKTDKLHWIDNPQGAHGDFIPLYDLVLRRRDKLAAEVIKSTEDAGVLLDDAIALNAALVSGETPMTEEAHAKLAVLLDTARRELGEPNEKSAPQVEKIALADKVEPPIDKVESPIELSMEKAAVEPEGVEPSVPSSGPVGAKVLFIGSSPDPVEAARKEPFVGQSGETLNELYLGPLGLSRSEIAATNVVPMPLADDDGRPREPTDEEVKRWLPWLESEIERLQPKTIIALGNVAKRVLGDRAQAALPHPAAVRRFGDSGEVSRKLRRVRELLGQPAAKIEKQPESSEGGEETSGFAAFRAWERTWQDQLPLSGKGKFVYQHHWRGLDEDQARSAGDEQLLQTDHSVHGDLRLEGQNGELWGWAVFIGSAADNKRVGGDKLFAMNDGKLSEQDKLQASNKLPQPKPWLEVGIGKPMVVEPGGVGSTANKWSKLFALDTGTYQLGVARQHSVEIFLDGKHLRGRYLVQFAPIGDKRVWLIDKPADQKPMAETRELADVIGELRRKRQRYLFWGKPGEAPQKLDVATGKVVKSAIVPLLKERTLEDKRIVYGVVLDPYIVDAHEDWVSPNMVEETAHGWFKGSRLVTLHPKTHAEAQAVESSIVEYPSRRDYVNARLGEPHRAWRRKFGEDVVHSGAWILGVQLSPELWEAYKRDEIAAFSIEGFGIRTPTTVKAMPNVTFVDLVSAK